MQDDPRLTATARYHIGQFYEENPFLALLGIRVTSFAWGRVRLDVDITHPLTNVYGIVHGGVTVTLADTAMGGACLACNKQVVTLEMGMNFIKPVSEGGHAYAVGEVVHNGSHTMVCEAQVFDGDDELCLKSQATFFVLREFADENQDKKNATKTKGESA